MSSEALEESSQPHAPNSPQASTDSRSDERSSAAPTETTPNQESKTKGPDSAVKAPAPPQQVSPAKVEMRNRLPALDDDADVGVQKEHIVTRDGKADLRFVGELLASAAPAFVPKNDWQEYRVYHTTGGNHVFSKITRTVVADQEDTHEAEVFDPSPASMPSKLLKSAHDLVYAHPTTWMDAAVTFFGYDPLAKALYRKLSVGFEERIS